MKQQVSKQKNISNNVDEEIKNAFIKIISKVPATLLKYSGPFYNLRPW